MAGAKGKKKVVEDNDEGAAAGDVFEDFLETYEDDSKFGGKSLSSPIKAIEVKQRLNFLGF